MSINLQKPDITELKPRITVFGVGGGGGNAVNNMITAGLQGVDFVVANTDAQALSTTKAERIIQLGAAATEGLGAGSQPGVGQVAAEECIDEIIDHLDGVHMCFVTAGMGGGTGTGAAPIVARAARDRGILTVGVVTKPFDFEGSRRMRVANSGIEELQANVDTLIVIPNQNLFRIANEKTTFADAFAMADQVLYSGVACITDLMVNEGLINLDFADVRSVMHEMGKAMMGTGEATGEGRAMKAAEAAIANPLLDDSSMQGAGGLLISITGGCDMTLYEVDEAATRIREEVDPDANIILGATFDDRLEGAIRVSVVATGIDKDASAQSANQSGQEAVVRPNPKPKAAPVQQAAAPKAPIRVETAQPVARSKPAPVAADPVADAIRMADQEMINGDLIANELDSDDFLPNSKLFATPAPSAPVRAPVQKAQSVADPVKVAPVAQEAVKSQPRMPRVEDFPPVGQVAMGVQPRAIVKPAEVVEHDERGPMGILRRLKTGLTRKEDEMEVEQTMSAPREPQLRNAPAEPRRDVSQDKQVYAPRRGKLDDQGRPTPVAKEQDEDQLEIPAFLRRQTN